MSHTPGSSPAAAALTPVRRTRLAEFDALRDRVGALRRVERAPHPGQKDEIAASIDRRWRSA